MPFHPRKFCGLFVVYFLVDIPFPFPVHHCPSHRIVGCEAEVLANLKLLKGKSRINSVYLFLLIIERIRKINISNLFFISKLFKFLGFGIPDSVLPTRLEALSGV